MRKVIGPQDTVTGDIDRNLILTEESIERLVAKLERRFAPVSLPDDERERRRQEIGDVYRASFQAHVDAQPSVTTYIGIFAERTTIEYLQDKYFRRPSQEQQRAPEQTTHAPMPPYLLPADGLSVNR